MERITGTIKNIIYVTKGFSIFNLEGENKNVICLYNSEQIDVDETVSVEGEFEINSKYGERFKVVSITRVALRDEAEILKYLASSLFVGIGPKTAKKIVEKFGKDTLNIINNDIGRLKEVEGIGKKKFLEIESALKGNLISKEIIMELTEIGFSLNTANKIYNLFFESSINVVKNDPYVLIEKLSGFGFKKADLIGERLKIPKDSVNRITHGIMYVMKERLKFGNTFVPYEQLVKLSKELLEIDEEKISSVYKDALSKGIIVEKEFNYKGEKVVGCFLINIYMSEYNICSDLIRLYSCGKVKCKLDVHKQIKKFEKENKVKFSEDQIEALVGSIKNNIHIITGGPGTGKTTIIKCILNICLKEGLKPIMVAPTGRAAKRMMETTGVEAKTIHRLLEISSSEEEDEYTFMSKNGKFIKCDVIIVDESSMVDVLIGSKLISSLKIGTRLIVVGDVDQCATRFCA